AQGKPQPLHSQHRAFVVQDLDAEVVDGQHRVAPRRAARRRCFVCLAHGEAPCVPAAPSGSGRLSRGRKRRVRGSKAAWTASAKMLADSTRASMNRKAASRFHQIMGSRDISMREESIMVPKEGVAGSTPMPR